MTLLDGNALAGRLDDLLGWDATASEVRCTHCGLQDLLATAAVYASAMGAVVRCRACDAVLLTVVDSPDGRSWFGMPGLTALEMRRR
jgi:phage FluMu protein Com